MINQADLNYEKGLLTNDCVDLAQLSDDETVTELKLNEIRNQKERVIMRIIKRFEIL